MEKTEVGIRNRLLVLFTVVFGRLAGVPSDGLPYPLFAYAGLLLWSYISGVVSQSGQFGQSDPEQAGFVQVMQGKSSDPERARQLMAEDDTDWGSFRPDILGTLSIGHADGEWTMAIYFTSEAEAREGERKEPPADVAAMMKEMDALSVGEPTFLDLTDPWLSSPG